MTKDDTIQLDEKDKKILDILINNARTPTTKIASKVHLSHDTVKYRINKMKESGLIESFTTVVDPKKLGLVIWGEVILSLWNLTPKRYEDFVKYAETNPRIAAVWNMSGRFEWWIEIYAKNLEEFNEITSEIKIKFSDIIKDSESMFVLKEVKAWQSMPMKYPI